LIAPLFIVLWRSMVSAATPSQALPTDAVQVTEEAIVALVAEGVRVVAERLQQESDGSGVPLYRAPDPSATTHAQELLLGLTHDIRSPLSSILMLVERIRSGRSGPVTPLQERQLSLVYGAAFGLSAFADDVLEQSRGGARLFDGEPRAFAIHDVFRSVRELVQPIAEEKGLSLRCSAPVDDRRIGHPAAIQRVVLNLVTNALKFTNSGLVSITASYTGDSDVAFEVSDSGSGMPVALRARFQNGSFDPSDDVTSAGLGLGLCARLVQHMHGTLHYVERAPNGSTVWFALSLPRA